MFRQVKEPKNLHAVLARLLCKIWHILQQESCSLCWSVSCKNLTIYISTGKLTKSKSMQPSDVAYRAMSASRIGHLCDTADRITNQSECGYKILARKV